MAVKTISFEDSGDDGPSARSQWADGHHQEKKHSIIHLQLLHMEMYRIHKMGVATGVNLSFY